MSDKCRPVEINGEVVRVHGEREMNDRDREMFAEVIVAVKRKLAEEDDPEDVNDD